MPGESSLICDAWFNGTRFTGDNLKKRNPRYPILTPLDLGIDADFNLPPGTSRTIASTQAQVFVAGGRATYDYQQDGVQLLAGVDLLGIEQALVEQFDIEPMLASFATGQPAGNLYDVGAFAEVSLGSGDGISLRTGLRGDIVATRVDPAKLRFDTQLPFDQLNTGRGLFCAYALAEWQVTDDWRILMAGGHAQRAPTLNELYADGVFVAAFQSGFNRLLGNVELQEETDWQIDLGASYARGPATFAVRAFHSWLLDYITYEVASVAPTLNIARYRNTPLATLAGVEGSATYALGEGLLLFGSAQYVDGRDRQIDAPLIGILPLQAILGLRRRDPSSEDRWGCELAARMSARQNRLGTLSTFPFGIETQVIESPTPGYVVGDLRGYYRRSPQTTFIAGVENFTNKLYRDVLDLRNGPGTFQPGVNYYCGAEMSY